MFGDVHWHRLRIAEHMLANPDKSVAGRTHA
jgi:hypothetical protein